MIYIYIKRSAILRFLMSSGGGGGGYVELSFRFLIFLLRGLRGALCFVCYDWPKLGFVSNSAPSSSPSSMASS